MRLRALPALAGAGMIGAGALHVAWGRGSSFPAADREALFDAVLGARPRGDADHGPIGRGAPACYAVAAVLAVGAFGINGRAPWRRLVAFGVVAALGGRGVAGLAGLMPQDHSPVFRRWNRRRYSPLCLVLAGLAAPALAPDRRAA